MPAPSLEFSKPPRLVGHEHGRQRGPARATRSRAVVLIATDGDLMRGVCAGDHAAFEELYRRYRGAGLALAARVCGASLAEDALQEAFTSIWRSAGIYRRELGTPGTWIMGIVRNRAIDVLRRQHRHARRRAPQEGLQELDAQRHTEQEVLRHDDARAVRAVLPSLAAAQRNVLELTFYDGLTQREIAYLTGAPLGTVKGRTRLALARLRRDLLAQGYVLS